MSEYLKLLSDEQVADMRDHFYKLGWGQNETMWKCWNQALDYIAPQLSASQAREAALREKLEAAEIARDSYMKLNDSNVEVLDSVRANYDKALTEMRQRAETAEAECLEQARLNGMGSEREARLIAKNAELRKIHADEQDMRIAEEKLRRAAEARIKASQGQEPEGEFARDGEKWVQRDGPMNGMGQKLYKQPPIPPESAELQRELDRWKNSALTPREEYMQRENAELTRKLAEQQAAINALFEWEPEAVLKSVIEVELSAVLAGERASKEQIDSVHNLSRRALTDSRHIIEDVISLKTIGDAELRKLLEESKVPEGIARLFAIGDRVTKIKGSQWTGRVVGTYSTKLTPEGYAIESETETGSVQIYPATALVAAPQPPKEQK